MAPRPTGEVIERDRERGRVFALRFRAYGRRQFVTLGGADAGWTRQKAEAELRHVLADVERGLWAPSSPANHCSWTARQINVRCCFRLQGAAPAGLDDRLEWPSHACPCRVLRGTRSTRPA